MYKKLTVLFLVLLLLAGCSSTAKLRYKGEPGEVRRYKMAINMDQTMEMMGNEVNINMEMIHFLSQEIVDVEKSGNIKMSVVYDSMQFDASGPQIGAVKDKLKEKLGDLEGKKVDFTISDLGKMIDFASIDSLIPAQLRQVFNPKQSFGHITPNMPKKALNIGDTWDVNEETPVKMMNSEVTVKNNSKYSFVGIEKVENLEFYKIKMSGNVSIEGEVEQMGMKLFIEGDGDVQGEFLFNQKAGYYYSGSQETEMDMTIAATGQQNMTIPMSQFMKIKISKIN